MNLDTVINETKDGKTYVLIYPIKTINGNVTYKKFQYYLYEGLKDYIVFTRVDITDLILLERNHVTSACLKEKALIDMRKLLIDNPEDKFYLLWVDIDDFCDYNHLFTRKEGDKLLVEFYHQLLSLYKTKYVIGQTNADNFILLIPFNEFNIKDYAQVLKNYLNLIRTSILIFQLE